MLDPCPRRPWLLLLLLVDNGATAELLIDELMPQFAIFDLRGSERRAGAGSAP